MCTELSSKNAIPHVLAGVETILCLPPSNLSEEDAKHPQPGDHIPALVAAIWFFVIHGLSDKETTKQEFKELRDKIFKVFGTVKDDEEIIAKVGGDDEELWAGWESTDTKVIQSWIVTITGRNWLDLDWYTNIENEGQNGIDVQIQLEEEVRVSEKRKLGTTMQDGYDYLSEENKEKYRVWKETMLATIDDLIANGVMDMDTTEG